MTSEQPSARYTHLDLLRGFAAFSVLIIHYEWFYTWPILDINVAIQYALPIAGLLMPIYKYGGLAVELFWLISGTIFFIKYADDGEHLDFRKFWIHRFARLYPLHIATLFFIAAEQWGNMAVMGHFQIYQFNDLYHFGLQVLFASDWGFEMGHSFNGPIWSVSIEILVYLGFALYIRYGINTIGRLIAIFVALTFAMQITQKPIALCASLFFLGGVIVEVRRIVKSKIGDRADALALAVLPMIYLALFAVRGWQMPSTGIFYYVVLPVIITSTLALDCIARPVSKSLRWIGDLTYATYLLHMPILMLMKDWLDGRADRFEILASPIMLLTYLTAVYGCAAIVHWSFEMPAQRWIRDKFQRPQRSTELLKSGALE